MATLKTCFRCCAEKPRTEFYKHAQMGDGLLGKCKACTKKDVADHRAMNPDSVREYDRARAKLPHRLALSKLIHERWRVQHPDRRAAHLKVQHAIRAKRLIPQPCEICGIKAEAHHPDYSQPLDVIWLCSPHHKQAHALVRK